MWMYSTPEKRAFPFLATRFAEGSAKFSPDGRWISYRSDESGRTEAYVQSFPASGGKWQISTNGGGGGVWSPKGNEIFYPALDGKLMVVPVKTTGTFEAGIPKPVLDLRSKNVPDTRFYIAPDGQRILVNAATRDEVKSMTFVENWTELLRKP